MSRTPSIRTLEAHEWHTYRDLRLRALADSPDAFGSTLAAEDGRPDAAWAERLAEGSASDTNHPVIAEVAGEPAGLAWGRTETHEPEVAHLYQMWVAPDYRALGAGRMLLDSVIEWARSTRVRVLVLGVTCGDTPATRLYARAGFEPRGEPEPLRPGSDLLGQEMHLDLRES